MNNLKHETLSLLMHKTPKFLIDYEQDYNTAFLLYYVDACLF
jgi:hypothetical protein